MTRLDFILSEASALSGETILVVDDGPENREFVIEYILEPNGFKSLTAKDGREGLQMAVKHRPDLILLDLQMPRMNGIEVLQALAERNMDIPIVLMTFHGSEEIAVEVYRLGVRDYVKKPYSVEEMLQAIERSLSEARLRKEKEELLQRLVRANRELQQRVQELNILYRIGKTVTSTVDLDKLLVYVVDAAVQMTEAEEGRLYLLDGPGLRLRAEKTAQNARPRISDDPAPSTTAIQHVLENGRELLATQELLGPDGPQSAAFAPLVFQGDVTGILSVSNISEEKSAFTQHDTALLSALTDYATISIENSRNFLAAQEQNEAEKDQIRGTFERFVAPSVVEQALANPEGLKLGGVRQEVSIVFADIRGYTAWSEQESPERVMEILNDYLSLAAEVVMGWEGTLDKYFGDGVMAIFNAPERQENHIHRATDAALALLKAAEDLKQQRGYNLSYSVGVNVGEAVVGYIGMKRAMNYTAIGDVVNMAKRLQETAKPGQILVAEPVLQGLGDYAETRLLGDLRVRNRKAPIRVHQLIDLKPLKT